MAIIGWICMLTLIGYTTLLYIVVALNGLGKYNIGGVPNSLMTKLIIIMAGIGIIMGWIAVIELAPFTVTLT